MRDAFAAMMPPSPRYALTQQGRPSGMNIMGALAHHPALARAYFTLNGYLLLATTLTERQRELVIMRVAVLEQSSYEWVQHVFLARDAGLSDLEIAWIAWGPDAPFWSDSEGALLRAVDELVDHGVIGEQTWTVLSAHLSTQQILDVIFTAGSYAIVGWMVKSLGIELDEDLRQALSETSPSPDTDQ
jgi:alkylhydroperoxidase family enzyme